MRSLTTKTDKKAGANEPRLALEVDKNDGLKTLHRRTAYDSEIARSRRILTLDFPVVIHGNDIWTVKDALGGLLVPGAPGAAKTSGEPAKRERRKGNGPRR